MKPADDSPFRDPTESINARIGDLMKDRGREIDEVTARQQLFRREVWSSVRVWSAMVTAAVNLPLLMLVLTDARVPWWFFLPTLAATIGFPVAVGGLMIQLGTRRMAGTRRALARTGEPYADLARASHPIATDATRGEAVLARLASSGALTILGIALFQILLTLTLALALND